MLSALRKLGGSGRPAEVESLIVADLGISPQEQNAITKSGQSRFINQLHWVKFYLMKAGFISSSERGVWSLTEKGNRAELTHSAALDVFKSVQEQFPKNAGEEKNEPIADEPKTVGVEDLGASVENYRQSLLTILKQLPPAGFEKICQRLLRESGFQEVTVTGRSGDGGIDGHGVLQINPFVSFKVLFQCKRYDGSVGSPQVRDFRGAMLGRADKGVILTTGTFSLDARKEAVRDGVPPLELVDGETLISMFERLELGLKPVKTYEPDLAFFDDYKQ